MNEAKLYYTAPEDKIFEEVKSKAIEIWKTYDNKFGYVDEKVDRIKEIRNVKDNLMYIVAMFDSYNQFKLSAMISPESRQAIHDRIIDGGGFDGIFGQ